jgi:protein-disulfide isomerase
MKRIILAGALLAVATTTSWAQDTKVAERAAISRMKGAANAPVTVHEIADFQCPYCARFVRDVYPRIDSAYVKTGKVRWIYINLPLPMHANSWAAAEAAMCAGGVASQFWPMHDRLFLRQEKWASLADTRAVFAEYAKEIGLDAAAFASCVSSDRTASLVVRDVLIASEARVTGTPAFVINDLQSFSGYKTFEEWKEILDGVLKKAAAPK